MAVVLATALAAVGLAMVLAAVTRAAPQEGFFHARRNLSLTGDRFSAYPDLAVSPDGDRVAAVWVEGYDEWAGYWGDVYLRGASESGGDWRDKILIYDGEEGACAKYKTAVAVDGTTAHVAYVVYDDSCQTPDAIRVFYRTCSLVNSWCQPSEQITYTSWLSYYITWVDLAVDKSGNPHIVWARYTKGG